MLLFEQHDQLPRLLLLHATGSRIEQRTLSARQPRVHSGKSEDADNGEADQNRNRQEKKRKGIPATAFHRSAKDSAKVKSFPYQPQ